MKHANAVTDPQKGMPFKGMPPPLVSHGKPLDLLNHLVCCHFITSSVLMREV